MSVSVLLAAAVVLAAGTATTASARDAAPDSSSRTGVLVFLDSWNRTVMPISVAELRADAERRAESSLLAGGRRIARTEDLVDLAWRRRVRTGRAITRTYLADLDSELDVTELVVVQLIVEPARLVILARSLDTRTGTVGRVWIEEEPIVPILAGREPGVEAAGLQWALSEGFGAFAAPGPGAGPGRGPTAPVARGTPVVMFPVVTVGCGIIESLMATHTVLAGFQQAAVPVVDPAVVQATLQERGFDPARLDAVARRQLAEDFGVDEIVQTEMLAYDSAGGGTRRGAIDEVADVTGGPRSSVQSFSLIMRRVDLRDGAISPAGHVHVQHLDRTGWFGHVDDTSLLSRLQQASASLWNEFRSHWKEHRGKPEDT